MLELLQDALSNDRFRLSYQPIASLHGDALEKYEILLRLHDRNDAVIPPSQFLPVAERNGLMQSIDRWVVEHAIQMLRKPGDDRRFFVNVSNDTLHDAGFPSFLKECLSRHGADGGSLVFELNAANLGEAVRLVSGFAAQVGSLNCTVSIEQLSVREDITRLLEQVPAGFVKLGEGALQGLADDRVRQERLKVVVRQASQKSAETIAGFVEDAGCLQLLWNSGVHYIQGNFLQVPDESLGFDFAVEGTAQENFQV